MLRWPLLSLPNTPEARMASVTKVDAAKRMAIVLTRIRNSLRRLLDVAASDVWGPYAGQGAGVEERAGGGVRGRRRRTLHADAEVTVLLFVKEKVVANFAFRAGELTPDATAAVLTAVPKLFDAK